MRPLDDHLAAAPPAETQRSGTMIELEHVTKVYRTSGSPKVIMHDVSLKLPRGRSVGLLGRNGSGKSTLLRMIGGAIDPDDGVIHRRAKISWPLGFGGGFHRQLTGAQNARFIARIFGVDTDSMVDHVADFSELGEFLHMPVGTYSSGMRARLAFATSMAVDFDVYLVDEITAVGDQAFKKKCQAAFQEKSAHSDVVMVSHSANVVRAYCQSGIVLEKGALTYFEDVEEALAVHLRNMEN